MFRESAREVNAKLYGTVTHCFVQVSQKPKEYPKWILWPTPSFEVHTRNNRKAATTLCFDQLHLTQLSKFGNGDRWSLNSTSNVSWTNNSEPSIDGVESRYAKNSLQLLALHCLAMIPLKVYSTKNCQLHRSNIGGLLTQFTLLMYLPVAPRNSSRFSFRNWLHRLTRWDFYVEHFELDVVQAYTTSKIIKNTGWRLKQWAIEASTKTIRDFMRIWRPKALQQNVKIDDAKASLELSFGPQSIDCLSCRSSHREIDAKYRHQTKGLVKTSKQTQPDYSRKSLAFLKHCSATLMNSSAKKGLHTTSVNMIGRTAIPAMNVANDNLQ